MYQEQNSVVFNPAPTDPRDLLNDMFKSRHTYRLTEVMNNDLGEECYVYMHDSNCCEDMYKDNMDNLRETLEPTIAEFYQDNPQDFYKAYEAGRARFKMLAQENRPRPTVDEFYAAYPDFFNKLAEQKIHSPTIAEFYQDNPHLRPAWLNYET
jgi:hypothetical protein